MATDRKQQIKRQISLGDVWAFIRARIERQQAEKKRYTLQFEVSVEADGRITGYTFQPPKERERIDP